MTETARFGVRLADSNTAAKRYKLPRYVVEHIRDLSGMYGSQGRTIQIGMEILSRMQYHPVPLNATLQRGIDAPTEIVGATYKLVPRTIELIDKYAEGAYQTRGRVFEALLTVLSRRFIA